ncbi:MAG TPA: pectinesterase family protein [Phycisphaerae bacterium]|nr:pectinesterase family protein [Phycisphaerae bacterium]
MKRVASPLLVLAAVCCLSGHARGQDKPAGQEPIDASIKVDQLQYDYLVDGDLPADDPASKKFKTLQSAYQAAPAGTEAKPTVIGIKPNVYQLPGGNSSPGMNITKNWITLLGLTNNRREVVLADNRGHAEGAADNGFVLVINATGFTAKNLTILNYCNTDYEYPGNPAKNLKMRNPTITQAVALQASGDKHVYENVALLSRLDTMFLQTTRSYFKNVYIEGTDDFIGGGQISVWDGCEVFFPTGSGVMSSSNVIFMNTTFVASRGFQLYKAEFNGAARPSTLINCIVPVAATKGAVAWVRGRTPPRPGRYSLTYHVTDAQGNPATLADDSTGAQGLGYSRELSDQEALAFNPWNLLRGNDDWDPAASKTKYQAAGNLIYGVAINSGGASIRTGGSAATLAVTVTPARATDRSITWSTNSNLVTLNRTSGPNITVTANNTTGKPEYVPIHAKAANGFYSTAWIYVEPQYIDPPIIAAGAGAAKVNAPADGKVSVSYTLNPADHTDQSVITWYLCDDPSGAAAREVAVSRGNVPLKELTLTSGAIGKYIRIRIEPKHEISDPGSAVYATSDKPITAADITSPTVSPDLRNFVLTPNNTFESGMWTVIGTWTSVNAEDLPGGWGLRVASQGAMLLYQNDADVGDMQFDLVMSPEKTGGQAFGSPGSSADGNNNQKADIFIKYDPRTRNGYSLRIWRTTESANKCMFQFFKIANGTGTPLSTKSAYTGVFKPNTTMTLKVVGNRISAVANNSTDAETLSLEDTITPNKFGGAGVYWSGSVPRGNSIVYDQLKITYPAADKTAPGTR